MTVSVNEQRPPVGFPGFSVPVKIKVCVVGEGGGTGTGAAVTTAVWPEVAVTDPAEFDAVTAARSVKPASAFCTA